jgi:hypothetical protein
MAATRWRTSLRQSSVGNTLDGFHDRLPRPPDYQFKVYTAKQGLTPMPTTPFSPEASSAHFVKAGAVLGGIR